MTTEKLDQELTGEKAYLGATRAALARMLDLAHHRVATGEAVAGDRYTAETLGRMLKSHAKELSEEPDGPLYFGRIQFDRTAAAGDHSGQCYYLGRRHIVDATAVPMVIDWRAPVSQTFYRASARDRHGVTVRRRYGWAPSDAGQLTGFEDERLDRADATTDDGISRLVAAEIERPRVGPMRDIVATIQPEQDELVRAELTESVCIQGAPGTGKTAVGLHRAAYLLYTYRERLRRNGVLVVGPNTAFLGYISAVLPALGEVDVQQRTIDELIARRETYAPEPDAVAAIKHDVRMAVVLNRALTAMIGTATDPLTVPDGSLRWRISVDGLNRLIREVREFAPRYAAGRERLRARVVGVLQRQAEGRAEVASAAWAQRMGRSREVRAFLDQVWPARRADELVASLLGQPDVLARAADGILTTAQQQAIRWPRPRTARTATWSAADAVLIDEAAGLIEAPESFGHVVVDEAQDLSAMQCRVLARRSEHGTLTVLGDLAQGTTPWAARGWPDQLAHLGKPTAQIVALTAGFRVPAAVLAMANRLLAILDVDVPATRAMRLDGGLRVSRTDDLAATTVALVGQALAREGSIAVVAAEPLVTELAGHLRTAGIEVTRPEENRDSARVTVLPVTLAKGLEYDQVIVVEPADIMDSGPRGPHLLYVALTRAVSNLDIAHRRPLPPAINA